MCNHRLRAGAPEPCCQTSAIKNQLDIDAEKWAKEVENRSKAGKKGMEKRWGKKSITEDNSVISDITFR